MIYKNKHHNGLTNCPACKAIVRKNDEYCPYCAYKLINKNELHEKITNAGKGIFINNKNFAINILLATIILVYILQVCAEAMFADIAKNTNISVSSLIAIGMGSNFPPLTIQKMEIWRLITSCFLHFGILHVLFNSIALRQLSVIVNILWGWKVTIIAFITAGVGGGIGSIVWNYFIKGMSVNSAGASGAICGLLGMLLGAYWKDKYSFNSALARQLRDWAITILVYGILISGIDNAAHIGGFITGGIIGYIFTPTIAEKFSQNNKNIINIITAVVIFFTVVSAACATIYFFKNLY